VQWQRECNTRASLPLMKSWVDTTVARKDTWLVLVIHGVDGLGYEALSDTLLNNYFSYIKNKNSSLWIATFGDVTKYMREREATVIKNSPQSRDISLNIAMSLNNKMYNIPLTLKTYIPGNWKKTEVRQGKHIHYAKPLTDEKGAYVLYQAYPNGVELKISGK